MPEPGVSREDPARVGHQGGRAILMERKSVTATLVFSGPGAPDGSLPGVPSRATREDEPVESGAPGSMSLEFERVYETHFDFVWRSLRLLGVDDAALEDAAQDTFSVVSRQLDAFEGRSALRTWLF